MIEKPHQPLGNYKKFMKRERILFISLVILISSVSFARVDEIVIFNQQIAWSTMDAAKKATNYIEQNVKSARIVRSLNKVEIADFVTKTYKDGTIDIIILFGYLPETIYEPGNNQKDNSLIEKFIDGGNIVFNTGDYIFFVSRGSNGIDGLKTITDSNFDCMVPKFDNYIYKPTIEGEKYVPSLPAKYDSKRPIKKYQVDVNTNWEIEIAFGSAVDGIALVDEQKELLNQLLDPVILKDTKTAGRLAIVRQTPREAPDRGAVITEIIDNYLSHKIKTMISVDANKQITTFWAHKKN